MTLDYWIASPLALALGRALAHFLWQGALLAAALRVALFLGAERSSRWRHRAATACLLAMPVAFGVTVALLLAGGGSSVASLTVAPRMVFDPAISQDTPAAPVDWLAWLAPLWIAGVILFYAFRLAGWVRVDRMRRRGVCAAPVEWQQRLRALAGAVRVSQPVVLLESCLATVPQVIGYWRPVILMPLGALAGLSAEQVEAILIHELAHIRRADYLVSLAQSLIEGLFFFHPAVWWIGAVVRAEREYACDDDVIALRPNARTYAAALTTLEQSRWLAIQAAAAANGGNLIGRVRRLLGESAPARVPSTRASALAGALVLVAGVAIVLMAWPAARSFAQAAPPAEAAADKQSPATEAEPAVRNIEELEKRLANKQKEIQEAEQSVAKAQELLQRNSAQLDLSMQNAGGHTHEMAQVEEQLRQAEDALKQVKGSQVGRSQEMLQQQERALQQAANQVQELANGKLDEALRTQQQRLARADMALHQAWAANGEKSMADIEKQLQQARNQLERLSESWSQQGDSELAQAQPPEAPRPQTATESESVYQKWLNEDIAYIITAEERRAFLAVKTDADRDQFIERFWRRRDPAPGNGANVFKQEYYRRIAYANQHFASSVPGWKTDRGRIYIIYGPPDEIDDHPNVPRQLWRYTQVSGLGDDVEIEFTDPGKTGELRMTAPPASHGSYWQVMVSVSDAAGSVARSLQAQGFPAIPYPVRADRPSLTQVLVGPYPDEASFAKAKAALEAAGFHPVRAQ